MSQPSKEAAMAEFRENVDIECAEYYLNAEGRFPSQVEMDSFFEEYMDGDIRRGEE